MIGSLRRQSIDKAAVAPAGASRVTSFNHDGVELAKVRKRRGNWYMPAWHVIFFIYVILIVRLIAMADMGPGAYQNRIDRLSEGSFIERAAARVMYMDPVSRDIATDLRQSLKAWAARAKG